MAEDLGDMPPRRPSMGDYVIDPENREKSIRIPGVFESETAFDEKTGIEAYERLALGTFYTLRLHRREPDGSRVPVEKTTSGRIGRKDVAYLDGKEKIVDTRTHSENFIRVYYQRRDGSRFYQHQRYGLYDNKATVIDRTTGAHSRTIQFGDAYVRRYWDAGDGRRVLTGKKTLLESRHLLNPEDGPSPHVKVKRLGGLINRTYALKDPSEVATKGLEAAEGRTLKRRVGLYRMAIGKDEKGQETTTTKLGKSGKFFSRKASLDSKGRLTTETTFLNMTFSGKPGLSSKAESPRASSTAASLQDGVIPPVAARSASLPDMRTRTHVRRLQKLNKAAVTAQNTTGEESWSGDLSESPKIRAAEHRGGPKEAWAPLTLPDAASGASTVVQPAPPAVAAKTAASFHKPPTQARTEQKDAVVKSPPPVNQADDYIPSDEEWAMMMEELQDEIPAASSKAQTPHTAERPKAQASHARPRDVAVPTAVEKKPVTEPVRAPDRNAEAKPSVPEPEHPLLSSQADRPPSRAAREPPAETSEAEEFYIDDDDFEAVLMAEYAELAAAQRKAPAEKPVVTAAVSQAAQTSVRGSAGSVDEQTSSAGSPATQPKPRSASLPQMRMPRGLDVRPAGGDHGHNL